MDSLQRSPYVAREALSRIARRTGLAQLLERTRVGRAFLERYYRPAFWDGYVVSYPKSGRTWLRLMLGVAIAEHLDADASRSELLDLKRLGALPGAPRINVVHDGLPQFKRPAALETDKSKYRGKRVVLLVRDPRDVVVSHYWHAVKREGYFEGPISEFVRHPRHGIDTLLAFLAIWHEARDVPERFEILRYEDMLEDPAGELRRALACFGLPDVSDAALERAVEFASFDNMRRMEERRTVDSFRLRPGRLDDENSYKVRRGGAGGWREELASEDVAWIERRIAAVLPEVYGYGEPAG